eukprot:4786308-Karenia_brevis.AAC.1
MGGPPCSDCMSSVVVDCLRLLLLRNAPRLKGAGGGAFDSSTCDCMTSVVVDCLRFLLLRNAPRPKGA